MQQSNSTKGWGFAQLAPLSKFQLSSKKDKEEENTVIHHRDKLHGAIDARTQPQWALLQVARRGVFRLTQSKPVQTTRRPGKKT